MADAAARARLEAAQSRHAQLTRELASEPPVSPEHQRELDEKAKLMLEVSTIEGRLGEALRREDELVEHRARGWPVLKLVISATVMVSAALPGVLASQLAAWLAPHARPEVTLTVGIAGLAVPLVVNGLRWRRGRARAEASRRVRAALVDEGRGN